MEENMEENMEESMEESMEEKRRDTEETETKPFNLIFGENHLQEISIQTVIEFLKEIGKQQGSFKNIVLCVESYLLGFERIYNNEKVCFEIYTAVNEIAKEVRKKREFEQKFNEAMQKSKVPKNEVMREKFKLYGTFGFNRHQSINNLYDFVKQNQIEVIGMDKETEGEYLKTMSIRNEHMAKTIDALRNEGKSTITIVGAAHLPGTQGDDDLGINGLYTLLNGTKSEDYKFFLIDPIQRISREYPYLNDHFKKELKDKDLFDMITAAMHKANQKINLYKTPDPLEAVKGIFEILQISNNANELDTSDKDEKGHTSPRQVAPTNISPAAAFYTNKQKINQELSNAKDFSSEYRDDTKLDKSTQN